MENFWHKAPFLRLLLPLVAGILLAIYHPYDLRIPFWVPLVWVGLMVMLHRHPRLQLRFRHRSWLGILVTVTFLVAGYTLTVSRIAHFDVDHYLHFPNAQWAMGVVVDTPQEKQRSYKVEVKVVALADSGQRWENTSGKALIYLEKTPAASELAYGDQFVFPAQFNVVPPPQNPEEFNYKRYLYFHQIYRQAYFREQQWHLLATNRGHWLMQHPHTWRSALLATFQELPIGAEELGVAQALVLGYKADLSTGLRSAYASAGAMHVLAVSGLHVGIIFFVLNAMLRFLGKTSRGRLIRAGLLIMGLWAFAAITGLSASVMRAATMFSFIILANATGRQASIYNTLAVSAFFLLIIDPFLIMEVGFQLSYLAVLGIVYLQPRIYGLFTIHSWLGNKVWEITAVSLAAQITTFPLGLLYFHQFPNYFLLSNLLVIPAAMLILYLGLATLLFSWIKPLAWVLAKGLHWLIFGLNTVIQWVEHLPYSIYEGASITIAETWLIYLVMIAFAAYFTVRNARWARVAVGAAVLLAASQLIEGYQHDRQHRLVVYNIAKTPALNFIEGDRSLLVSKPDFYGDKGRLLFHIQHHWWARDVVETTFLPADSAFSQPNPYMIDQFFGQFAGKKLVVVSDQFPVGPLQQQPAVDYLVLSGWKGKDLNGLLKTLHPKEIIIDASNPRWRTKRWQEQAKALGVPCHAVLFQGAWVRDV